MISCLLFTVSPTELILFVAYQWKKIKADVEFGYKRRSQEHLNHVFKCHSSHNNGEFVLFEQNFASALKDLHLNLGEKEIHDLFKRLDLDCNNYLSLAEFQAMVSHETSEIERWARSIPLHQLLVDAITSCNDSFDNDMECASNLKESDVELIIQAISETLKVMVMARVSELNQAFASMRANEANQAGAKFVVQNMSCGNTQDFHKGLEGRIGDNFHIIFYGSTFDL